LAKNETCEEFVTRIWGPHTEEQLEGLLWHCTAFPCVDIETLEKQLKKVKEQSGGNYKKAMEIAEKEINEAMKGR
jgi:hypothetical protein